MEFAQSLPAALIAQASAAHPLECCGLLLGKCEVGVGGGGETITAAAPAANVHPSPASHFEIDPAALIGAHRAARGADGKGSGPQVLGYYHSHPAGPAAPSATDRACASGDGRIWAIIAGDTIGWWRDTPQGFVPLSPLVNAG